jgi:ABC-type phosphate/phosphonate transport system ATPase subunit
MAFVVARGLNKSYAVRNQRIHVLRDLALTVEQGEMLAIVGASGVGKSTLLHVLGGLDRADAGTVEVAGRMLTGMDDRALVEFRNQHVGFVFQFHHLLPEFDSFRGICSFCVCAAPGCLCPRGAGGRPSCSRASASPTASNIVRPCCRAASSSASPWRAPW